MFISPSYAPFQFGIHIGLEDNYFFSGYFNIWESTPVGRALTPSLEMEVQVYKCCAVRGCTSSSLPPSTAEEHPNPQVECSIWSSEKNKSKVTVSLSVDKCAPTFTPNGKTQLKPTGTKPQPQEFLLREWCFPEAIPSSSQCRAGAAQAFSTGCLFKQTPNCPSSHCSFKPWNHLCSKKRWTRTTGITITA